jgi:26S proteasome non-ATPase regulatory subunit 9
MASPAIALRADLQRLEEKRTSEEQRGAETFRQLLEQFPAGTPPQDVMTAKLVDKDGYPRADVDVYRVRHLRQELVCLRNDLKAINEQISKSLEALHALPPDLRDAFDKLAVKPDTRPAVAAPAPVAAPALTSPFALVDQVSTGSPAEEAGIRVGDKIAVFGPLVWRPSEPKPALRDISGVLTTAMAAPSPALQLQVHRPDTTAPLGYDAILLTLVPHAWSGQGVLGCHVVPI